MSEIAATDIPPLPPLSIVALDDDEDFREFVSSLLENEGHDVRTPATPAEFFAMCESRLPDVVILDMKMGHASGEEVLAEIRRRWPRLCVIIATGYPSMDSMRQTFRQDVFDYIAKPFSIDVLLKTLADAARALGLGQRPQDKLRHDLGRHIRLARIEKGLTLKDVSESSGVSVSQLSSVERGTHLPSLESLLLIAAALERKPSAWLDASGF
jgi:CheY-like chemotaxis protein/lambda repressor-like predicted transcriptional regulator